MAKLVLLYQSKIADCLRAIKSKSNKFGASSKPPKRRKIEVVEVFRIRKSILGGYDLDLLQHIEPNL